MQAVEVAGIVTFIETGSIDRSARVGWGVLLARTVAVGLKVGVSMAVMLPSRNCWCACFLAFSDSSISIRAICMF